MQPGQIPCVAPLSRLRLSSLPPYSSTSSSRSFFPSTTPTRDSCLGLSPFLFGLPGLSIPLCCMGCSTVAFHLRYFWSLNCFSILLFVLIVLETARHDSWHPASEAQGACLASAPQACAYKKPHLATWLDVRGHPSQPGPHQTGYCCLARSPLRQQPSTACFSPVGTVSPLTAQHAAPNASSGIALVQLLPCVGQAQCHRVPEVQLAGLSCRSRHSTGASLSKRQTRIPYGGCPASMVRSRLVTLAKGSFTAAEFSSAAQEGQGSGGPQGQRQRQGLTGHALCTASAAAGCPGDGACTRSSQSCSCSQHQLRGPPHVAQSPFGLSHDGLAPGGSPSTCSPSQGQSGAPGRQDPPQDRGTTDGCPPESRTVGKTEDGLRSFLDHLHESVVRDRREAVGRARDDFVQDAKIQGELDGATVRVNSTTQMRSRHRDFRSSARLRYEGPGRRRLGCGQGLGIGGCSPPPREGEARAAPHRYCCCPGSHSFRNGQGKDSASKTGADSCRPLSQGRSEVRRGGGPLERPCRAGSLGYGRLRRSFSCTAICTLAFWQGQQQCLDTGFCWPCNSVWPCWVHTVVQEVDFVSPQLACLFGLLLERELIIGEFCGNVLQPLDPRISLSTETDSKSTCQVPLTTLCAGSRSPAPCLFPTVTLDRMDSLVHDSQLAKSDGPGDSRCAPHSAQGNTDVQLGCTYFSRADLALCTAVDPSPSFRGSGVPTLPDAGCCHSQLQPASRSSILRSGPCREGLKVRFSFAVSFWFPGSDQLCLTKNHPRSYDSSSGPLRMSHVGSAPSNARSPRVTQGIRQSAPCAVGPCLSQAEHVGFARLLHRHVSLCSFVTRFLDSTHLRHIFLIGPLPRLRHSLWQIG